MTKQEEVAKEEGREAPLLETDETKGLYGPISFPELDEVQQAQDTRIKVMTLTDQFLTITHNIMYDPEIEDKGNAVMSLAGDFAVRVKQANKELDYWVLEDNLKAKWSASFIGSLPDSSFLYIEPGGKKEDNKTTPRSLRHLPYKDKSGKVDLPHIRNAISRLSQSDTGTTGGKKWLTASLRSSLLAKARRVLKKESKELGIWDHVKAFFGFEPEEQETSSFTVWKENGETYWLAVYSNNYRDDDSPPEILSADSHKEFIGAVDAGDWPHPELWLWHQKGTKWGKTTFLAYDEDTGFTVAAGKVDEGREHIAIALAELPDIAVSHGMPSTEIKRDKGDSTVITRYRTREISPLPHRAAANKATGFCILKENDVMLPKDKKDFLAELGVDLDALEATLTAKKEELDAAGVDSKEIPDTAKDEPAEEEPVTEEPADLVAQLQDVIESAVSGAVEPLLAEIEGLKEAHATLEAKQAEDFLKMTPAQSLTDMLAASIIGKPEVRLDGRSSPAKDKPKETDPQQDLKGTGIPFVDAMRSGKDWRETFTD